jgi:hypothetical protein
VANLTGAKPRGLKERKEPPPLEKPWAKIPQVSAKTQAKKASADGKAGVFHMHLVAQCPCVICEAWPVEVHHTICGRFGSRKSSDFSTIPLCVACHRGPMGIHANKSAWVAQHGPDTDYLPVVEKMIAAMLFSD